MRMPWMIVLFALVVNSTQAQTQHQARDWHCVRQHFLETTDGDVLVLQCVAALPKDEKLDAEDEDTLTKLEVARYNAMTFKQAEQENPKNWPLHTGKGKELMDGIRMGFGQQIGQLCQKHPNIVLAPFSPDLTSGTTTLCGCKNIITAPEK
jgi:hypothetical protein